MNAIVSVDENMGIGKNGELLERIPGDMQHFKNLTKRSVVVMGRKTFDSIPNAPLDDRFNIVVTKTPREDCSQKNLMWVTSIEELLYWLRLFKNDHIFVIGGASIYAQLLEYCNTIYLTKIHICRDADAFFPHLSPDEWELTETMRKGIYKDIRYSILKYMRCNR